MPCVSVKRAAWLGLTFFAALLVSVEAREYQPVERPALRQPVVSRPAPQKSVPKVQPRQTTPKQTKETVTTPPVKIPKFEVPNSNPESGQRNAAPESKPQSAAQPAGAKLFGTVEFRRPLDTLPGWLDVLKRNSAEPIFIPEKHFNKSETWKSLQNQAQPLAAMDQLRLVNKFWNGWPYREDMANWGKADYWEIPAQFLLKSGDCEDYAIVKYFTLKELGFDPAAMRIVVLRDTIRNLAHAVLAVYLNGDVYILDNLSNVVLSHRRLGNYSPQFSVNESGRWTHIKGKPAKG